MNAEPVELLISRIMNQYNKKPEGWAILTDRRGNVLIFGPKTGYRLKLLPLNPQEYTGVGIKIDNLKEMRRVVEGVPSYGFRPLSNTETEELLNTAHQRYTLNKLINKLLDIKPVPTGELKKKRPKAVLSGPVVAHPNLSAISNSQKELEAKLAVEADKLFRRKYPGRAEIYR
ncbi:hypothetical protein IBX35_05305 [Candidatus Bathyarchaeota archaeon]|nr:hypothetical protein [Candidatus Bathyarchaeota archaeon]